MKEVLGRQGVRLMPNSVVFIVNRFWLDIYTIAKLTTVPHTSNLGVSHLLLKLEDPVH